MRPTDTLGRWCTTAVVVLTSSLMASADEGVFRISDQASQPSAASQTPSPSIYQPVHGQVIRGQDPGDDALQLAGYARKKRLQRRQQRANCPDDGCGEGCYGQGGNCQNGNCDGNYCNGAYCDASGCYGGCNGPCCQRILDHMFGWLIPSGCAAPVGKYRTVYAHNPTYAHPSDGGGQAYGVQGYGISMAVPLAPNVRQAYNYSWGIPSSRITPIGHNVVGAVGSQPLRHRTW